MIHRWNTVGVRCIWQSIVISTKIVSVICRLLYLCLISTTVHRDSFIRCLSSIDSAIISMKATHLEYPASELLMVLHDPYTTDLSKKHSRHEWFLSLSLSPEYLDLIYFVNIRTACQVLAVIKHTEKNLISIQARKHINFFDHPNTNCAQTRINSLSIRPIHCHSLRMMMH
jgi:hypothetical protein